MHKLLAAIIKESKLLLRDKEALLILFGMPVVFVLIMSLALRDSFQERVGIKFPLLIVDQDRGGVGKAVSDIFSRNKHFVVETIVAGDKDKSVPDEATVKQALIKGRYKFAILIPADATKQAGGLVRQQLGITPAAKTAQSMVNIRLLADPSLRRDYRNIVITSLNRALQGIESAILLSQFAELGKRMSAFTGNMPGAPAIKVPKRVTVFNEVTDEYDLPGHTSTPVPTSVQQNAPAWTLLAMFFLVIPLSVALIKERQQGSLQRLQSMPVPGWVLLAGKVAPYFIINQIQVALILLEGMYLLPRLGGDALEIGDSPAGLMLLSVAISLAAIGYGLLIASFSRTQEQANTFGAISILILAAIGGIMVPKLVMPPLMQQLSVISPLSWGLEGFLDIFIRGAHAIDMLPRFFQLTAFAGVCFILAVLRFQRQLRHN